LIFSHELKRFVRVGADLEEFIKIPEEGVTFSPEVLNAAHLFRDPVIKERFKLLAESFALILPGLPKKSTFSASEIKALPDTSPIRAALKLFQEMRLAIATLSTNHDPTTLQLVKEHLGITRPPIPFDFWKGLGTARTAMNKRDREFGGSPGQPRQHFTNGRSQKGAGHRPGKGKGKGKGKGGAGKGACWICGKTGHQKAECPSTK
jgi:hypothetical protein